jgi:hypothetical protein
MKTKHFHKVLTLLVFEISFSKLIDTKKEISLHIYIFIMKEDSCIAEVSVVR